MVMGVVLVFFQAEDGIRDYKVTGVQTCALPICAGLDRLGAGLRGLPGQLFLDIAQALPEHAAGNERRHGHGAHARSEEHTSELQSPCNLVCRLLLEKKNKIHNTSQLLLAKYHST